MAVFPAAGSYFERKSFSLLCNDSDFSKSVFDICPYSVIFAVHRKSLPVIAVFHSIHFSLFRVPLLLKKYAV